MKILSIQTQNPVTAVTDSAIEKAELEREKNWYWSRAIFAVAALTTSAVALLFAIYCLQIKKSLPVKDLKPIDVTNIVTRKSTSYSHALFVAGATFIAGYFGWLASRRFSSSGVSTIPPIKNQRLERSAFCREIRDLARKFMLKSPGGRLASQSLNDISSRPPSTASSLMRMLTQKILPSMFRDSGHPNWTIQSEGISANSLKTMAKAIHEGDLFVLAGKHRSRIISDLVDLIPLNKYKIDTEALKQAIREIFSVGAY